MKIRKRETNVNYKTGCLISAISPVISMISIRKNLKFKKRTICHNISLLLLKSPVILIVVECLFFTFFLFEFLAINLNYN